MPQITIRDLSVVFPSKKKSGTEVKALDGLTLDLNSGMFHVVVGYSGCGKTTLLRCIAGLQDYKGELLFDGRNAASLDIAGRNLAFVTQQYTLYPRMTVFDNIAFPLLAAKVEKHETVDRVYAAAQDLGLIPCLTRKPKQISGGQQQRAALARALVKKPDICLLDEPLSNVDAQQRTRQRQYIKKALSNAGCTVVYVTHDMREAMAIADNLIVMNEGRVSICGAPLEVYESGDPVMRSLLEE